MWQLPVITLVTMALKMSKDQLLHVFPYWKATLPPERNGSVSLPGITLEVKEKKLITELPAQ